MPTCIYCRKTKVANNFEPEHVLSRGLCGEGANWTLSDAVCKTCNRLFSKSEAHWMRQAFEAMARNFQGPQSRNDVARFDRLQPIEIDDLYILMRDDPLVYEAGFAFPNEHHFRPQMIDTGHGLLALVGREQDTAVFQAAIDAFLRQPTFDLTVPIWHERHDDWLIARIERRLSRPAFVLTGWSRAGKPSGIWLRGFPHDNFLTSRNFPIALFTSRVALDHRGRLYLRAANVEAAVAFLDLMLDPPADSPPSRPLEPGDQTVALGLDLDLVHISKCVLKTGFNLFCHFFGSGAAMDPSFNLLRALLLAKEDDDEARRAILRMCTFEPEAPPDFPKGADTDQHRMQLDLTPQGLLRFRLRLYGHLGYCAILGPLPAELRSGFRTRRVVVDFASSGIREVETWD
jgi:hypothetical protein